mmetsp:Transcript_37619/g.90714  ORF Transcript_37619/g.90714 Transcript_37619/m.90714 type:complete len:615 (+) Transcript_37619:66-1910(+)
MSLRQRGQRPSEATNEGGYYAAGGQERPYANAAPGSGNGQSTPRQQQQPTRRHSQPSSGGYPGVGTGYYGTPNARGAPSAAPNSGGSYAGTPAGYNNRQPVQRSTSYPNTAAAYNPNQYGGGGGGGGYNPAAAAPGAGFPARAINLDGSAAYGGGSGATYGGYNANAGGPGGSSGGSTSHNPYKKGKSSSGFGLGHVLLSVLAMSSLVLTGTAIYYRNVMKAAELELERARESIERRQRTGGRFGQGRNDDRRAKQADINRRDVEEKKKLEREIARLEGDVSSAQKSHEELVIRRDQELVTLDELKVKKQDLLKTIDHTGYLLEDKKEETEKYKSMVEGMDEVEEYMKKREGALWKRIEVLESSIGRESWREVEEWFGLGPHKVEILLEYPNVIDPDADPSTWPRIRNTLEINLAPLDLMPHTVHLFLQQVHHGLWDGCSVISSPKHIFQFGPSYDDEDEHVEGAPHYDKFHERGLDKVSYQEYSDKYKHDQWTIGLAGRPGGPDFYINKLDNSLTHGPGGQINEDDMHNEADPCFGKVVVDNGGDGVVSGKEILDQIARVPTDPDQNYAVKYPVVVIEAKVLAFVDGWGAIPRGMKLDKKDDILPLPEVPHGV